MFKLIIRYFGFLKHIPLVPHVYDALLKIQVFFTNRELLNYMDDITEKVGGWQNITISTHKYGGTQFNFGDVELGHLHGNGLLDVLLNREVKTELMKNQNILDHHTFKNSGWISFLIRRSDDRALAIEILERAYIFRQTR